MSSIISAKRCTTQRIGHIQLGPRLSDNDKVRLQQAVAALQQAMKASTSKDRSLLLAGDALIKIKHVLKDNATH